MSHSSCSLRGRIGVGVPSPPGQSWPVHMGCQVCRCPSCHPPSQTTPLYHSRAPLLGLSGLPPQIHLHNLVSPA